MPWHSPGVNAPKSCCLIAGNPGISLGANVILCTGRLAEVEGFERRAGELVRAFLEAHRGELHRDLDLGLATFVCVSSVETLAHGAVLHRPELLAGDRGTLHRRSDPVGGPVPHLGRQIAAAGVT
ncbi:hypothetical protein [Variovorax sp. 160MFSha2.1]|uniref:hypothetical protein n=1 Tax=Variovorax sp. 160MFSha2.1 TaxID=3158367 RepID=UPI003AAE1A9D